MDGIMVPFDCAAVRRDEIIQFHAETTRGNSLEVVDTSGSLAILGARGDGCKEGVSNVEELVGDGEGMGV